MSQPPPAPDLVKLEHDALAALEQQNAKSNAYTAAALPGNQPAAPAQIDGVRVHLRQMDAYYRSMTPVAQRLSAAGRPRVAQYLNALLADLQTARGIWDGMYRSAVGAQQAGWEIAAQARRDTFDAWQQMHDARQAAYDEANARWRGEVKKKP
jgi:hypothetical protein